MKTSLMAVAAATLLLTACSPTNATAPSETPEGATSPPATQAAPTASATAEASAAATETTSPAATAAIGGLSFGDTYTWPNGLAVTISKPKVFKPSQFAAADVGTDKSVKSQTNLMFNVRVVNNTGKPFEQIGFYFTMQSGNAESEQIFDSETKLEGAPSDTLLKGRTSEFKVGFRVKDPNDLAMNVMPEVAYKPATFRS